MTYDYNKDDIKNSLEISQIADLIAELGGEPQVQGSIIVCKTICHGGDSHKLYYYDNTKLFRCYTGCAEPTFDIFELVRKVKERELDSEFSLPAAIDYVAQYFGFSKTEGFAEAPSAMADYLTSLENYDRIENIEISQQRVELKEYDGTFLKHLPRPIIEPWIKDGISKEIMDYYEICYDPKNCGIVIPHRDVDGKLIGVRERTLIKENEKFGKYRPAKIGNKMYNHPLSFNLYGLYQNKANIKNMKKVFVFESEKSVLQYATMFGQNNNISVATCGQNLTNYQMELLYNNGAKEIIIAWDREGQKDDKIQYVKKFYALQKKYGSLCTLSFMYDKKGEYLEYKMSPTDNGKENFLLLYKERIMLY